MAEALGTGESAAGAAEPDEANFAGPCLCVDHLVWVVPSLPEGIARFEYLTGVTPCVGGRHEGLGTHNALVSLGCGQYLELLAADPSQAPCAPWLGLDATAPRLTTFCARPSSAGGTLQEVGAVALEQAGYDIGAVVEMSRKTPDGGMVRWLLAAGNHRCSHAELPMGGLIPFLIDWTPNERPHPSETAPSGCRLAALRAWHPEPEAASTLLTALGAAGCLAPCGELGSLVGRAPPDHGPWLEAQLDTPKGSVTLS